MLRKLARKAISASIKLDSHPWQANPIHVLPQRRPFCLGVLPNGVDRNSEAFIGNSGAMDDLISELQSHINKVHDSCIKHLYVHVFVWVKDKVDCFFI